MKFSARLAAVLSGLFSVFCLVPSPLGADVIKLQVTAEQANVREKPDITSAVLEQASQGAILEAERKEGEWYAVRVEQETGGVVIGYVHESLVRVVGGTPAVIQAPPKAVSEKPADEIKETPRAVREAPRSVGPPPGRQAAPPPREREGGRASISIWYGGRYAVVGDLNEGAKGQAAFFADKLGATSPNEVGFVHLGRVLGAEYRHPLVRGLDVAIGIEYFSAERSSSIDLVGAGGAATFQTTPRVSVVPLSLALVLHPVSNIYVKTGLDLSFAHCQYFYRFEQGGLFQDWQGKADSVGLAYVLGAGLEWRIAGPVSVLTEASYRSARIGGFDGDEVFSESGKSDVQTTGSLYFFRAAASDSLTVPQVFIRAAIPAGAGITETRKAELSLSGLSLRVGLKVAL